MLLQQHISCLISIWRVNGTVWQAVHSPVSLHRILCAGRSQWMREEGGTDFIIRFGLVFGNSVLKRANLQLCMSIIHCPRCSYMVYRYIIQTFCTYVMHFCNYTKGRCTCQRPFHKQIKMTFD